MELLLEIQPCDRPMLGTLRTLSLLLLIVCGRDYYFPFREEYIQDYSEN